MFEKDIEESFKVWWDFFPPFCTFCTTARVCCCNLLVVFFPLLAISLLTLPIVDLFQELKIEGEQPEVMEEDNLDLMLPDKRKKPKKVDFDETDTLDKEDGENE